MKANVAGLRRLIELAASGKPVIENGTGTSSINGSPIAAVTSSTSGANGKESSIESPAFEFSPALPPKGAAGGSNISLVNGGEVSRDEAVLALAGLSTKEELAKLDGAL